MMHELQKHRIAYLCLGIGLALLTIAFMAVWPDRYLQRLIIVVMAIFYFFWGIITHVKAEHISRRVIMEYLTMSLFAGFLLFLITL